jgi:hypothetical protein
MPSWIRPGDPRGPAAFSGFPLRQVARQAYYGRSGMGGVAAGAGYYEVEGFW